MQFGGDGPQKKKKKLKNETFVGGSLYGAVWTFYCNDLIWLIGVAAEAFVGSIHLDLLCFTKITSTGTVALALAFFHKFSFRVLVSIIGNCLHFIQIQL